MSGFREEHPGPFEPMRTLLLSRVDSSLAAAREADPQHPVAVPRSATAWAIWIIDLTDLRWPNWYSASIAYSAAPSINFIEKKW